MLRKDFVQTARTSSWAINMPVDLNTLKNDVYKLSGCDSGWDEAGVFLGGQEEDGALRFLCSYLYVLSVHAKVGNTEYVCSPGSFFCITQMSLMPRHVFLHTEGWWIPFVCIHQSNLKVRLTLISLLRGIRQGDVISIIDRSSVAGHGCQFLFNGAHMMYWMATMPFS